MLYTGLSGVGDVALNLVTGDVDRRCDHALLFVGVEPILPSYVDFCDKNDLKYDVIRTAPKLAELYVPHVAARLAKRRPDVVIAHGGILSLLGAILSGLPSIFVEHQPIPLRNHRNRLATISAARFAKRIVALTDDYSAYLADTFGASILDRTTIIPNGVDIGQFAPPAERSAREHITIGMSARFQGSKRFDLLIEMLAELRRRRPSVAWRLSLAGDGPGRAASEAMAASLGLSDSVAFRGMVAKPALSEWFRSIDIYAHASNGETSSMALLQAMATQRPIIGSDVAGIRDLLGGTEPLGLIARGQSGGAFANAVLDLVDQPEKARLLALAAHRRASERNSNVSMFESYLTLIRNITAKG